MGRVTPHSLFVPVMALLVVQAWIILWLWDLSPYGRYLHHGQWQELGQAAATGTFPAAGGRLAAMLFYLGGWVLMTTAMMLPTTLPLLEAFRRLIQGRRDRWFLMALVVTGYLSAWLLFGLLAHTLDRILHDLAQNSIWLTSNGWALAAIVFSIAGFYQFSPLKYRCLDKCRSPLGFVMRHWNSRGVRRHALLLGLDHGVYCVGCCWALMLLMFVLGTGSVGWMLLLGAAMAAEKNLPFGRRLAAPLGMTLLVGAAMILAHHFGTVPV